MKNGLRDLRLGGDEALGDPPGHVGGVVLRALRRPSRCTGAGPMTRLSSRQHVRQPGLLALRDLDLGELDELARELGVAPASAAARRGS